MAILKINPKQHLDMEQEAIALEPGFRLEENGVPQDTTKRWNQPGRSLW